VSGSAVTGRDPIRTRTLDRCLACGGSELKPLAFRYRHRGATFPLVECRICGMRFLGVQPSPEALPELYDAAYFQDDYRCGRAATGAFDEAAYRAEDDGLLDAFARLRPAGRLLEVGCAGGWLLAHARERGWQPRGVELSAEGVAHARSLGLEVHQGTLDSAGFADASFDLVYLGDVLEHVPDCRNTLVETRRVLAPGGHLYLRGPITTHSLARSLGLALCGAIGSPIEEAGPPYHLWEFRPRPLERLLRATGFEVLEIRQSKIPPGRLRGRKSWWQRLAVNALDAVNLAVTRVLNSRGDRAVIVARAGGFGSAGSPWPAG
jgi:SAM-dependent methyltransferase